MSIRYKDTEYTYISAKVRAMEKSLVGREVLDRMISADDVSEAASYLREYGFELAGLNAAERENVLISALGQAMSEIEKNAPDAKMFAFFRYPYDCSNIKSLIKCRARGVEAGNMLFSIGSVSEKTLSEKFEKNDFSVLPENMANAAGEAIRAYAETKNPQLIDFILDRACYADMAKSARDTKIAYIEEIVNARADLTDFMISLRILRMNCGDHAVEFLDRALIDCGKIGKTRFVAAFSGGEDALIAELARAGYRATAEHLTAGMTLGVAEKLCDDAKTEIVKKAKYKTYGIEIPLAYIAAFETEIQNIRIVLAGKEAKSAPDTISERIRECYV